MNLYLQRFLTSICLQIILILFAVNSFAQAPQNLTPKLQHLRIDGPREWSEFPETPEAKSLVINFESQKNKEPCTLQLRQQDVKQPWIVKLNEKKLGKLKNDENDMLCYFEIAANSLRDGENELIIEQVISKRSQPDDIRVGEIHLYDAPKNEVLSESTLNVTVRDTDTRRLTPSRITIVRPDNCMPVLGTESNKHLAIRAGTVYTSTGNATVQLPAGEYIVYAGRGFEYSVAHKKIRIAPGDSTSINLQIQKEVPTEGYVACDTHVHTFTYSRHGDSTIQERMVTIAGEGIEFPIATDHNLNIDYRPFAKKANVDQYFTPVIGNEVTTKLGHFNSFPFAKDSKPPNHKLQSWDEIFKEIKSSPSVRAIILNHARDIHSGNRPFGSKLYNEVSGEILNGQKLQANAMEVINSGATQTDSLELLRDWMTQLNRGNFLTPVGCSDSHDVSRYIIGQGRTYIRCDDSNPGNIDKEKAIDSFVKGNVLVSFGLIAEMKINKHYQSGELVQIPDETNSVSVDLRVLGPHWVDANKIQLYSNGTLIREEDISNSKSVEKGIKWTGTWKVDIPDHDVHLIAIATGPGITASYWPTAKPYQPTSQIFEPKIVGCSGAVWIDADNNKMKTTAFDYANKIYAKNKGNITAIINELKNYDEAIAIQVASIYQSNGNSISLIECKAALKNAADKTKNAFQKYFDAWLETIKARNSM